VLAIAGQARYNGRDKSLITLAQALVRL
jgi:hypothetical protein